MRVLPVILGSGRGQGQKHALPEVQKQGGQGEEEAKGGEKMTREEVVQAALKVERFCMEHRNLGGACDCPFFFNDESSPWDCFLQDRFEPGHWFLDDFLRTRGLKHD